jgi:glutathione synthase
MKIGFVVNNVRTEYPRYTTMVLAWTALCRGHEVYVIDVGGFSCFPDGSMGASAVKGPPEPPERVEGFHAAVSRRNAERITLTSAELDVLFFRHNPVEDQEARSWAQVAPIGFAQIAVMNGVLVLPDPYALWNNIDKLCFQHLPEKVRPRTLITRSRDEIVRFWEECAHQIVIKPLEGYGGTNVFLVQEDEVNLNQMIEAVARSGYVIAQEYLPAAQEGDVRLYLLNGKPLMDRGKVAAFRRVNPEGDIRSNMTVGGRPKRVAVTGEILEIAEAVGPLFIRDGVFFAGLDIAGDKLMEINVISPGGLYTAGKFARTGFGPVVIEAIEKKVEYRKLYGSLLSNRELACME